MGGISDQFEKCPNPNTQHKAGTLVHDTQRYCFGYCEGKYEMIFAPSFDKIINGRGLFKFWEMDFDDLINNSNWTFPDKAYDLPLKRMNILDANSTLIDWRIKNLRNVRHSQTKEFLIKIATHLNYDVTKLKQDNTLLRKKLIKKESKNTQLNESFKV